MIRTIKGGRKVNVIKKEKPAVKRAKKPVGGAAELGGIDQPGEAPRDFLAETGPAVASPANRLPTAETAAAADGAKRLTAFPD